MRLTVTAVVRAFVVALAMLATGHATAQQRTPDTAQASAKKPRIRILATGGTIAGAQASQTSYGYKSGTFKVDDLITAVPQMKRAGRRSPASRSPTSAART